MTSYEKLKVMKVANWLIEQLLDCSDADFADRVLTSIVNGEPIDQDEIEYITMAQFVEGGENE